MRIGLVDVDGHHFPNLALMRISSYHKQNGDMVEWWLGDLFHYDIVYKSKVFSFTPDIDVINADSVISGGSGYAISLVDSKEVYDKQKDPPLPAEIEQCFPDYSIYPEYDYAISMTSRGCPRNCSFCHVAAKEGRKSYKVADVKDFWNGQKRIEILDPNITACPDRWDLYEQYIQTGAKLNFNQGLDLRLITEKDVEYLNRMNLYAIHFAWDNPAEDMTDKLRMFAEAYKNPKWLYRNATVFVLTNYNSNMEQNIYRIEQIVKAGFAPYVMVYDKPHASKEIKRLQRWCNNRFIFRSCPDFKAYNTSIG